MKANPQNNLITESSSLHPDFVRIDISVSLHAMQSETEQLAQLPWVNHVNQRDYTGGWDILPLRCPQEHLNAHPILQGFAIEHDSDWHYLPLVKLCPTIREFLDRLECPLKSVRLMRLKAGAKIKPHRDTGLSIEYGEARLHLPIQMNDDVLFTCNHQTVPMRAGELWYIDADREHAVHNRGDEDRINLVIDCAANKWLRDKIRSEP